MKISWATDKDITRLQRGKIRAEIKHYVASGLSELTASEAFENGVSLSDLIEMVGPNSHSGYNWNGMESAPDNGRRVILFSETRGDMAICRYTVMRQKRGNVMGWITNESRVFERPTHWREALHRPMFCLP